jgi:hypothetical protein
MARRPAIGDHPPAVLDRPPAGDRLGIDQPEGWWPTAPRLKAYEAAGFAAVQVRMPPRAVLADGELLVTHATALAPALAAHRAPLQLEVHPSHRPEPERLVVVMQELLGLSAVRTPAPPRACP